MTRLLLAILLLAGIGRAQDTKRVLYVTQSAGYRHDSIPTSIATLRSIADRARTLEVVATEDLSFIAADKLAGFDAVFFFTSGELALNDQQKADLLDFVRSGKGFGGVHSATDTLYSWPEYGDMIGAYFDGHPWAQKATVHIEDAEDPLVKPLAPSFDIVEEFYQFRSFSRDNVHVLATLDTSSVDMQAPGIHRSDGDFALAWRRPFGQGRVFYTALGHFEDTWRDLRFQTLIRNALLWLTGQDILNSYVIPTPDPVPPEVPGPSNR